MKEKGEKDHQEGQMGEDNPRPPGHKKINAKMDNIKHRVFKKVAETQIAPERIEKRLGLNSRKPRRNLQSA